MFLAACSFGPSSAVIYPWLEIECSRCRTKRDVDLAALRHPPTTLVHDLADLLRLVFPLEKAVRLLGVSVSGFVGDEESNHSKQIALKL
jgi:hypothetical protein